MFDAVRRATSLVRSTPTPPLAKSLNDGEDGDDGGDGLASFVDGPPFASLPTMRTSPSIARSVSSAHSSVTSSMEIEMGSTRSGCSTAGFDGTTDGPLHDEVVVSAALLFGDCTYARPLSHEDFTSAGKGLFMRDLFWEIIRDLEGTFLAALPKPNPRSLYPDDFVNLFGHYDGNRLLSGIVETDTEIIPGDSPALWDGPSGMFGPNTNLLKVCRTSDHVTIGVVNKDGVAPLFTNKTSIDEKAIRKIMDDNAEDEDQDEDGIILARRFGPDNYSKLLPLDDLVDSGDGIFTMHVFWEIIRIRESGTFLAAIPKANPTIQYPREFGKIFGDTNGHRLFRGIIDTYSETIPADCNELWDGTLGVFGPEAFLLGIHRVADNMLIGVINKDAITELEGPRGEKRKQPNDSEASSEDEEAVGENESEHDSKRDRSRSKLVSERPNDGGQEGNDDENDIASEVPTELQSDSSSEVVDIVPISATTKKVIRELSRRGTEESERIYFQKQAEGAAQRRRNEEERQKKNKRQKQEELEEERLMHQNSLDHAVARHREKDVDESGSEVFYNPGGDTSAKSDHEDKSDHEESEEQDSEPEEDAEERESESEEEEDDSAESDSEINLKPDSNYGLRPMTIRKMLKRYNAHDVERCIHDMEYPSRVYELITRLKTRMAVPRQEEECKSLLRWIKKNLPLGHPIDNIGVAFAGISTRITAIQHDVIEMQEAVSNFFGDTGSQWIVENIESLVDCYSRNELGIYPNKVTVWYAGRMVVREHEPAARNLDVNELVTERLAEWREMYGPGLMWIENPWDCTRESVLEKRLEERIRPIDNNGFLHYYRLSVNLVDQENRPVILNCVVHDTASSYLEIYMDEAIELGLDSEYHYLGPMIRLETSNGAVFRLTFQVEVQLMADGHEVAEKVTAMACLVNDISLGQSHASGPFIQKTLFTATHPKGDLLIGANKTAIANLYRGR